MTLPPEHALPTVLVVDDVPENLTMITDMLAGKCQCRVATGGERALLIANSVRKPDVILLDVSMPGMDGYEVCTRLKEHPETAHIPVLFLTSMDGEEDEMKGFGAGGVDYITKPVSKSILIARLEAQFMLLRSKQFLEHKNEVLEEMVAQRTEQLTTMQDVIIMAMASLAETRDGDTAAHLRRVQCYSRKLALALAKNPRYRDQITDTFVDLLYKTCLLHDIGKVGVSDAILFKPGRLSREEFDEMKAHSLLGGQTLMEVERQLSAPAEFVSMAHEIALYHHERWDGSGYPLGLKGAEIPLSARIVALADTYDALTSERIYKPPYPLSEACSIIERERGLQFDPAIVDAFAASVEDFFQISQQFPDPHSFRSRVLHHLIASE